MRRWLPVFFRGKDLKRIVQRATRRGWTFRTVGLAVGPYLFIAARIEKSV